MKKPRKIVCYMLILALAFLIMGCSGGKPEPVGTNTVVSQGAAPAGAGNQGGVNDPDQPERTVDVYGSVRSIQGNLITLAKMVQPQSGKDLSDEEREAKRASMQNLSEDERRQAKVNSQVLTGETVQVLIPVGVPIKIKQNQAQGGDIVEGALTDIQQGVTLSIWIEGSAGSNQATAEYVRISGLN